MPDQVPVHVARERNRVLRELAAEKNRSFRESFVGQTLEVITLQAGGDGWTEALSDNYLKVKVPAHLMANERLRVAITDVTAEGLTA
jgi:threonylcarbamoyladenosine tRNA methylthiotransferase MtaB